MILISYHKKRQTLSPYSRLPTPCSLLPLLKLYNKTINHLFQLWNH
ncbi:MAG: hypothetical protein F6J94_17260 [Moorea sp. SIO1F2]|nr:hypothetical protein [Moorena sp. SIO1F2]NET83605.1 hypothetical protein [Moorena sp. SIO1F2]